MSYNIDTWKTKEINDLRIPLTAIRQLPYVEIRIPNADFSAVSITGPCEGFEIYGTLDCDTVVVSRIGMYGEGSGSTWPDLLSVLRQSIGTLVAAQVWEGGNSITRLSVKDGMVTEEQVEI